MAEGFLKLMSATDVAQKLAGFKVPERTRELPLLQAMGRVNASDISAPEALPPFHRSLMDGYAVQSSDVAAARETSPAFLEVIGQIAMGQASELRIQSGQAAAIPTGAMLPEGADAVVMVEYTRKMPDGRLEVTRSAGPGQHVLHRGEDCQQGAVLLARGRSISPLDSGALAACGVTRLLVKARPRVAILSTGDELVDHKESTQAGQVRDTNAITLAAQVDQAGGRSQLAGRVVDEYDKLLQATKEAVAQADMVLLSGGSSVGARDHTAKVLAELSGRDLLIEGIALSPGKPTLLAEVDGVPVFGLPGHPVSSFVVCYTVVLPLLFRLAGLSNPPRPSRVRAQLTANAPAAPGRETWIRVRLHRESDELLVTPVPGTSAVYSSLLQSDGLLRVGADHEGHSKGEMVDVEVLR